VKTISIEMNAQGGCDWSTIRSHAREAEEIVGRLSAGFAAPDRPRRIATFAADCPMLWEESKQLASLAGVTGEDVLTVNVLYDLVSSSCACTAFAVDMPGGPIHGHCLDWEIAGDVLRAHAALFRFTMRSGEFVSAGWPGFVGVFVGIAHGRFAVSVNGVWSSEPRCNGAPLAWVLRQAFARMGSFDELVSFLMECQLTCDCLLLVTGVRQGDMVVIERTPTRAAARRANDGMLLVTNHYVVLPAGATVPGYSATGNEPFGLGTQDRYWEAGTRLRRERPCTLEDCYRILGTEPFCHELTTQRVAMSAASGRVLASVCPPIPVLANGLRPHREDSRR